MYSNKEQVIPFVENKGHIFVKLKINHYQEGNFCFDTGFPKLIIDSSFYKKQKMTFKDYFYYDIDGVGSKKAKMAHVRDSIHFTMNTIPFCSTDNAIYNLNDFIGNGIDGIIGFNIFHNTPFSIDYINNKIILNPKIDDSYQEMKIIYEGAYMFLPMEITFKDGSSVNGNFIIDTGSNSIVLTSEFINNIGVKNSKRVNYKSNGLNGDANGLMLNIPKIKIGNFELYNHRILISKDNTGALAKNDDMIGVIGKSILEDFDVIYHPTASKIWIKPNRNFDKANNDLFKPFLLIKTTDSHKGWFVGGIYEESDAYQKGLRHRDEILEINNRSVDKMNIDRFHKRLKPNQKLKLKVKRNNEIFEIDTYLNVILRKDD